MIQIMKQMPDMDNRWDRKQCLSHEAAEAENVPKICSFLCGRIDLFQQLYFSEFALEDSCVCSPGLWPVQFQIFCG